MKKIIPTPKPKRRLRLPLSILDRYIIKKFIGTYFFSIILIIMIVIVFDFNEKIDKLTQAHNDMGISWGKIAIDYYLNTIPYFSNLFSSLFVFISVIFFTSKLADRSEIIAMRACGMSFKRILRPYMISATFIGVLNLVLGAFVIPHSTKIRTDFENKYIKKKQISIVDNIQLQTENNVIAFFSSFNNDNKSGNGFSLDKFHNKKLVSHLTALRIQYDTLSDTRYRWKLFNYQIREMHGTSETVTSGTELDTIIPIEPTDLVYNRNQQETMTTPQIYEYIEKQRTRGSANLSTFEIEFHKRFASACAALILTIIGVTLSCEKRKGGMGLSLGLGLGLSFSYILFQTISSAFATKAGMPAMLAAWIPNIIFSIVAFALYRKTPK
ncbi:MAG: LptF/LptG family permease [Bacteroidaceae bacterium]|nr:LptF/LptG family permease [Bacteroidaceae bacterium]